MSGGAGTGADHRADLRMRHLRLWLGREVFNMVPTHLQRHIDANPRPSNARGKRTNTGHCCTQMRMKTCADRLGPQIYWSGVNRFCTRPTDAAQSSLRTYCLYLIRGGGGSDGDGGDYTSANTLDKTTKCDASLVCASTRRICAAQRGQCFETL